MTVFIVLDLQVGGWTQSRGRKLQLNPVFAHSLEISLTNAQCSLNLSPCLALLLCPETHSGLLELKFCCSVNSSGSEVTDEFGGCHGFGESSMRNDTAPLLEVQCGKPIGIPLINSKSGHRLLYLDTVHFQKPPRLICKAPHMSCGRLCACVLCVGLFSSRLSC